MSATIKGEVKGWVSWKSRGLGLETYWFIEVPASALVGACIQLVAPETDLCFNSFSKSSSYATSFLTAGPHSTWHIGEEVAFEGDAVRREAYKSMGKNGGLMVRKLISWKRLGNR